MKKKVLLILLAFLAFESRSQDPNVLDRDWHIHELSINGSLVNIPTLPANPPADCILGLYIEFQNGISFMELGVCGLGEAYLDDFDLTSFKVYDFGGLTGTGPCYFGSTTDGCTSIPGPGYGELADFEVIHYSFYEDYQSTFTYAIIPPGSVGYETLHIQKPNGDYAIYGEVPPLSLDSNSLDTFSIYPNPASDVLYLKGNIEELKSVSVHTLSGKKINVEMEVDKIDVSVLPVGLYFIEINTFGSQKYFQKFIKK